MIFKSWLNEVIDVWKEDLGDKLFLTIYTMKSIAPQNKKCGGRGFKEKEKRKM